MINLLIIEKDICFAVKLMNYLNNYNKNIRVCNIIEDLSTVFKILNNRNDIDIILLNSNLYSCIEKKLLNNIIDKEKNNKLIVLLSENEEKNCKIEEEILYAITYRNCDLIRIANKIEKLAKYKDMTTNKKLYKEKITNQLLYLGYDISLKGTQYLIDTTSYVFFNQDKEEKLEKTIYPRIAKNIIKQFIILNVG